MQRNYNKGNEFTLSPDAIENYGTKYEDIVFEVEQWFDHVGNPGINPRDPHGHPGFDTGAGSPLYEAKGFPWALYQWEMNPA